MLPKSLKNIYVDDLYNYPLIIPYVNTRIFEHNEGQTIKEKLFYKWYKKIIKSIPLFNPYAIKN